ncbi:MAG: HTH-type transcriptional repressor YvoA [Lentisphaerae bacterium ADurb.Bin242]|nr:MAG: HTH-type transcriptional repressor YvoA [Lentisphaerae bacterium ADurb.Bin242]
MISTINKNDRIPLCIQLKNILIGEIREGNLKENERIPGERVIAEKYGVSRGTAVETLKLLEEEGYIERIATKGTFVSESAGAQISTPKILLPFPEKSISPEHLNYANWCADSETHQGIIDGAREYGMQINFRYFEDLQDRAQVNRQLKGAKGFDGAVFLSSQLPMMRKIFDDEGIPYTVLTSRDNEGISSYVDYSRAEGIRRLAEYVASRGFRNVGLLRYCGIQKDNKEKIDLFVNILAQKNVKVSTEWIFYLEDDKALACEKLKKEFPARPEGIPELFFCESVTHPFALYRVMADRGLRIGTDVAVVSHGSRTAFDGMIPSLTYLRIPYFEMGKEACRLLDRKIKGLPLEKSYSFLEAEIVEGESTWNKAQAGNKRR